MEPVTHLLTGAVLARTGLNRKAAYTTAAMVLAAEFPDVDTAWSFLGPVDGFKHHRGWTHTFAGLPFEALVLLAAFWLLHWRRGRAASVEKTHSPANSRRGLGQAAPVRWGILYVFILLALLSHLFLDWTNNYGVRPFFPFDAHWHAGSLLFIFDPLVFLVLTAALVLPALFRLIGKEVGATAERFSPRGWALGALVCLAAILGLRAAEHSRATDMAFAEGVPASASANSPEQPLELTPRKVEVSPDPFSPFRWHAAVDLGPFLQLEEIDSRRAVVSLTEERLDKPPRSAATESAFRSPLGRAYLDWSPMPAISVSEGAADDPSSAPGNAVVFFRDPRFMGGLPSLNRSGIPPLSGVVEIDRQNRVVSQSLDGREQQPGKH